MRMNTADVFTHPCSHTRNVDDEERTTPPLPTMPAHLHPSPLHRPHPPVLRRQLPQRQLPPPRFHPTQPAPVRRRGGTPLPRSPAQGTGDGPQIPAPGASAPAGSPATLRHPAPRPRGHHRRRRAPGPRRRRHLETDREGHGPGGEHPQVPLLAGKGRQHDQGPHEARTGQPPPTRGAQEPRRHCAFVGEPATSGPGRLPALVRTVLPTAYQRDHGGQSCLPHRGVRLVHLPDHLRGEDSYLGGHPAVRHRLRGRTGGPDVPVEPGPLPRGPSRPQLHGSRPYPPGGPSGSVPGRLQS